MILDGCHFQYGDFNSRERGLIFAHCDTDVYRKMMGNISSASMFNKRDKVKYLINDNYESSPIEFDAEVVSDNFKAFTAQDKRFIEKALFNKSDFRKLFIDTADDVMGNTYEYIDGRLKRLYFNCRFIKPEKIEDGSGLVVGYKFVIECDSCMTWQEPAEQIFPISDGDTICVEVDTDIGDYTYPDVTLQIGSVGGNVTITNLSDDATRLTKFNNLSPSIQLILKGRINYVSGQNYEKFENQNFIRLLDGQNSINVVGNVSSIKFKWNNRRFI